MSLEQHANNFSENTEYKYVSYVVLPWTREVPQLRIMIISWQILAVDDEAKDDLETVGWPKRHLSSPLVPTSMAWRTKRIWLSKFETLIRPKCGLENASYRIVDLLHLLCHVGTFIFRVFIFGPVCKCISRKSGRYDVRESAGPNVAPCGTPPIKFLSLEWKPNVRF